MASGTTRITRKLALLISGGAIAASILPLTESTAEGAPTPCPAGSVSAGAFRQQDIGRCVITTRSGTIGLNALRTYDIYCPGRMTQANANAVGRAIASSTPSGATFQSSIHDEFPRLELVPAFEDAPHVFHYGCKIGSGAGVATHVRLRLRGTRPARVGETAASCKRVAGSGHTVWSTEYKCSTHFMSNDSREFIYDVGAAVSRSSYHYLGQQEPVKLCILNSTNIQCAPCTTSDKLVVRLSRIRASEQCPAGTVREIRLP